MECLQFDWKNIDATYERDEFYESIQAPKWIDFTVPLQPVDDHAWFCGSIGCTHERKMVLQAPPQENEVSLEASKPSSNTVAPLAIKTASASVGGKKARGVVSSSLSSLSDIKAAYNKSRAHPQLSSICESKGETVRNARRQQASENENPNRACKLQEGACRKPILRAPEGLAKKTKMSESKGIVAKEMSAHVPNAEVPTRACKTASSNLAEQVNLSQNGPVVSEASKSTFVFGKRPPMHAKPTVNGVYDKDPTSDFSSISEAKIKNAGPTRPFSRPPLTAATRNSHLTASLAMPIWRRSAANARPLHGVYLGNDKVATCKPPKVIKDVRVTVLTHVPRRKKNDHKEGLLTIEGRLQQRDPQKDGEMQPADHAAMSLKKQELCLPLRVKNDELEIIDSKENDVIANDIASRNEQHAVQKHSVDEICVEKEGKFNIIQTRDKEDYIQNTLEKFLENLQLTCNDDAPVSDVVNSASKQDGAEANQVDCLTEQDNVDNAPEQDMIISRDAACPMEQDTVPTHRVDCVTELNRVHSHHMDCETEIDRVHSQDASIAMPAASQMSTDVAICIIEKISSTNCEEQLKKTTRKEDLKIMKDWQRHGGRKRKSSELNFKVNCSSRDHRHETQMVPPNGVLMSQQLKQSSSTAKLPMTTPTTQPQGVKEPWEEHNKRMKTTILQTFKPFRLRTEERGALKELGLGRKELREPNSKEMVHHALRMPSFGHPFIPQRSTKKLTIPREPKFHPSKARKACTSHPTDLTSS